MRAVWITKHGAPEVLEVRETPDPEPGAGELRVRAHAAGLNFAEVMARMGLYPDAPKPPCVVGYEAAGIVDALGAGVDSPAVGTRVLAMPRFGAHADTICVPVELARPIPERMSFEEAAAIPVNYLTAYHMLFRVASLRPGMKVLVHMAAGGVGTAVLQLCQTMEGVETFGTASESKHDALRAEGCHHPIDYRSLDYAEEVRRLTDGRGVDLILDALGGKDAKKGYKLLAPAGQLIIFGAANLASGEKRRMGTVARELLATPLFNSISLMNDNRTVSGVNLGHLFAEVEMLKGELDEIIRLYEAGAVKPKIDSTFAFADAPRAHRRIQERKNIGKIVLLP